ncbi:MAG: C10 family peptidase [Prevotellaceae bacterium]|nr:C10 family peptidase [Prevotellaceae bacterium]
MKVSIKKYNLILLSAVILIPTLAIAKPRTQQQMRTAAAKVLRKMTLSDNNSQQAQLKELKKYDTFTIYGYNGDGFAVIASDDIAPEVLGYSDSKLPDAGTNPNFSWWLKAVEEVVSKAVANNTPIKKVIAPDVTKYDAQVPALCTSKWGQEEPFWNMCPSPSDGVYCLTGCVATAMAQVLYYHKGPRTGQGTRTIYYPQNNTSGIAVTANFEEDVYDWDNMLDVYNMHYQGGYNDTQANAVALLMRDCGVASDMEYGLSNVGSGAYHSDAAEGLRTYFGIENVSYLDRSDYSESEWMEIVYEQISNRQPMMYGGNDWMAGGHSFVLDGYNSDGLVHINWGWDGSADGYYDIALLNPPGYSFSLYQDAIINIVPEGTGGERVSDTITVEQPGTIETIIADSLMFNYDTLKVIGSINSSDLKYLRKMAGRDSIGESTTGKLRLLDLKEASIVSGGDFYLKEGGKQLVTSDNEVPERAFYGCTLRELYLPESTKKIGDGAFGYCSRLDSVYIPETDGSVFIIEDNIIYTPDSTEIIAVLPMAVKTLTVSNKVVRLHDYAFSGRTGISELLLPSSVTSIGREALRGCAGLSMIKVYSKTVPTLTGVDVFKGIDKSVTSLYVPAGTKDLYGNAAQWKEFADADNIVEFGTTVRVRNAVREYGEENPAFGYQITGDAVSGVPEFTCEATPTSPVGRYAIKISKGTIEEEGVEFKDGYLIVTAAPLTVIAEDKSRGVGEENPEFTLLYEGFKNEETDTVFTEYPTVVCSADLSSPEGTYPIVVSGGSAKNYELSYVEGTLTVSAASGISVVESETAASPMDIYSVSGTLVKRSATSFDGLKPGVYIVNNRKVIVK